MTVTHQALYRRWRAQTFGEIVGQEAVVATLRNAVRSDRVAHALLFVGPRGTGKTSVARILAKALNCTDLRDGEPCDRCPSCVAIREGRALDVVEMDAASNNRVDDMRELLPRIYTAPSDLRRKVFIVDEVQRITQGWDVLLKTLEEPPDHVAFIFCTTDPSQIRPAVLSRVQRFDFRRLTTGEIEGKLRTILAADGTAADDDAVTLIAHLAQGGMRDAESMLDQLLAGGGGRLEADRVRQLIGLADADEVARFVTALVAHDPASGLQVLDGLEDRGRDVRAFLDQVVDALRDAILAELATPSRMGLAALTESASRLAAIDPTRSGPGGLRLQLELALLAPAGGPLVPAVPDAVTAGAPTTERSGAPPSRRREAAKASEPAAAATAPPIDPPPTGSIPAVGPAAEPALTGTASGPTDAPEPALTETASGPTDAPEPALAENASGPTGAPTLPATPATGAELAALREQWPEIVAYISRHPPTKPLISACRPIGVDGNVVTLGFPEGQAFLKDVADRRRANLEEGIGHFLGHGVAVRCVATNVDLTPELPADPDAARLVEEARRIFADDLIDVGEVG